MVCYDMGFKIICPLEGFNDDLTYLHNWSLQSFSKDYDLAAHTTYIVVKCGTYGLKPTLNDRFLRNST